MASFAIKLKIITITITIMIMIMIMIMIIIITIIIRPNIVVKDKKERTCLLIDMSVSTERNTSLKTMENSQSTKILRLKSRKRGE